MRPAGARAPAVELVGVRRSFGRVQALDGAELCAEMGEVHALLGENGAGKSTLLRVLAGLERPDSGDVRLSGEPVHLHSAREAWRAGVGMVHQHFALVPRMTVLENLALGQRTRFGLSLDRPALARRVESIARETGLGVPADIPLERLGVGERQRVEILRVLLRNPRILVLDEPTAVLTPAEVDTLFRLLRHLAREGRAVILVAHKLDEVLRVGERFTVLRGGRTVLQGTRDEVDAEGLARAMIGGVAFDTGPTIPPHSGSERGERAHGDDRSGGPAAPVVARLRGVHLAAQGLGTGLAGVDLELRGGEVFGVVGVEGNGQHELAQVLAGRHAPDAGVAEVPDDPGYVPGDRHDEGLISTFTLTESLALRLHRQSMYRVGGWLRWRRIQSAARSALQRFDIRAPGTTARAGDLSGGNQQRVVVARELVGAPALVVAENPTRGLDIAAAQAVHEALREHVQGAEGRAVVLLSGDLDEVLEHADRIGVMVRGQLHEVPSAEHDRDAIGRRMLTVERQL